MNVISPPLFSPLLNKPISTTHPPQLLSHPISKFQARALKAVAEVTGGNIHHHFTLLLPALIKAIVKAEEGGGEGEEGEEGEGGGEKGGEGATVEEDKVNARLYEYGVVHMKIAPAEFKATALSRIRDLYQLLQTLETKGAVRACSEGAGGKVGGEPMSIFGFSRLFVSDVNAFNAGVRSMVQQVAGSGSWVRDSHYLAYHRIRDSHYLAYHIVCEYCYPAYPIVREYHYL